MSSKSLLRDYPQLSYAITVLADDNCISQLSPDRQVVPDEFLARFAEGERQLRGFKDAELDELAAGAQDDPLVLELIDRAPEAASILDDAFDGPFWDVVFEPRGSLPSPLSAEPEPSLV